MTNRTAFDPHTPTTPEDRLAVEICLHKILDAAKAGDADLLASHHLYGPKFTKFDDFEPLERQEADEARAGEDAIAQVDRFHYKVDGLRIDVFGPTAIATFVLDYGFDADGDHIAARARSTLVFVADGPRWKIAHEHLSPLSRTHEPGANARPPVPSSGSVVARDGKGPPEIRAHGCRAA